ncbi:hypothetical protein BDZ94DRAFT_1247458 [Collybia nuda]|uniref:Uncharacterized protein n=1 Tax=Collybia nuda TaxID=64659 RepID=A0A9P6CJ92_9AGAR|nr:hypothetical protein BDZ94DRAFT_1247458 [Collybia nuda]
MSPASSAAPSSAPALVPRAVAATPTQATKPTATETASGTPAAPTSPPGNGQGVKGNGKITTITRKGRDGNSTVYHVHHGTKTRCYAQETGAVKGGQGAPGKGDASGTPPSAASGGPQKTPDVTKPNSNTPVATSVGAPSKGTTSPKLAARYEELLERYYGEIDELD